MNLPLKFTNLGLVALALTACGSDNDNDKNTMAMPEIAMFQVEITNITSAQPLSPPAVVLSTGDYQGWMIGSAASTGLEKLAESGNPADFISMAAGIDDAMGDGVLMPGQTVTLNISATEDAALTLTVASMLGNTNDGFSGVTGWRLNTLMPMQSQQTLGAIYDAGTEANTESMATVPGPAAGGEGYNTTRDDVNFVAMHPGVVSADDGLASSALNPSHRFDNGAMRIRVTRL